MRHERCAGGNEAHLRFGPWHTGGWKQDTCREASSICRNANWIVSMSADDERTFGRIAGIVCTVLGGMLSLWVIARLSSAVGWQQTWAPPFAPYEWVTLGGAAGAAGLLIVGLLQWTPFADGNTNRHDQTHPAER